MISRPAAGIALARDRTVLHSELEALRRDYPTVTLVPTMGALHEGHLNLVDHARRAGGAVVVSVFVNPLQFGPGEDFERYPRDLVRDVTAAEERGAHAIFAPTVAEMYGSAEATVSVDPGELGTRLCGPHRPGHFRGVLTVVAKLFGVVRPDRAVFGRKDFQQSVLIRRMVDDLDLGVGIDVAPTVREADGLALSSRNAYLTAAERREAARLSGALFDADRRFREGETRSSSLLERIRSELARAEHLRLQYVEAVHPDTLDSVATLESGSVIALAAFCGRTRLIDNVVLGAEPDPRLPS